MTIKGYGKVRHFGYREVQDIFTSKVEVQEKIDGSQFSFGMFDGVVHCRSKNNARDLSTEGGLFGPSIQAVQKLALPEGFLFRAEAICREKHNKLAYERVPKCNVVVYDVYRGEDRLGPDARDALCHKIGLEPVQVHFVGEVSREGAGEFIGRPSQLGGIQEGVVIKSYSLKDPDGVLLKAKIVGAEFQEMTGQVKLRKRATPDAVVTALTERYRTNARWDKAIQHLTEDGKLVGAPKDIGPLCAEIHRDFDEECQEEVKQYLYDHFGKQMKKNLLFGFAQYYNRRLTEEA